MIGTTFAAQAKALDRKVLFVENIEQAALWLELDGQLSDGHWENARPYDHWKVWCSAEVMVAPAGQPVGRTFAAMKSNYNFAAPELLDAVALRMLSIVRIARAHGLQVADILEHAPSCEDGRIDWSSDYMQRQVQAIGGLGVTTDMVDAAIADKTYGLKDLTRDLRALKAIVKVRVEEKR
jgi:hypothetical protein